MGRVVIVGAGPVGCLLAIQLARVRREEVSIYEKRRDMRKEPVDVGRSINLALSFRGIKALNAANLGEAVLAHAVPVGGRMRHTSDGDEEILYGTKPEHVIYSIERDRLNCVLLDAAEAAGVKIRFDCALESLRITAEGAVQLQFTSDTVEDPGMLFGCDGVHSAVRTVAQIPGVVKPHEGLVYKELTLSGSTHLSRSHLHIWPLAEGMLMALPNEADGSFTMTLFHKPGREAVLPDFGDSIEDLSFPLQMESNPSYPLYTVECVGRCYGFIRTTPVALLGDAAHAMLPFYGQGLNAGFEDITKLVGALDEAGGEYRRAVAAYSLQRMRETAAIASRSRENYEVMRQGRKRGLLRPVSDEYGLVAFSDVPYSTIFVEQYWPYMLFIPLAVLVGLPLLSYIRGA